ncbi:MAG: MFS transporter [Halobacteriota archaeon]
MAGVERRPWGLLAACFLASVGYNAYLIAPASLLPLLASEYGISSAAAGWAISATYLGWLCLQLPSGILLDRIDNRHLIALGSAVLLVAAIGGWIATSYWGFLAWRIVGGATAVFLFTGGVNVVSASFSAAERGFASAVFVASAPIGFAVAQFGSPQIAASAGLPIALLAYPIVSVLSVPGVYYARSDPIRAETSLSSHEYRRVLTDRPTVLVSAASGGTFAFFVFLNSWMPTYGTDVLATSLVGAGAAAALLPLSGVAGRPIGGWLSDRIGRRRKPIVLLSLLLSLPALAALTITRSYGTFAVLLVAAGFCIQLSVGVYFVYVRELAVEGAAGTSLAILMTFSIGGALVAPVGGGWLIDQFGWQTAFVAIGAAATASIGCVLAAPDSDG